MPIILAVRIGCLAILAYWSFVLLRPFLSIIVWSVILTVALYPIFEWASARLGGRRAITAGAITFVGLIIILGPATLLGISLAESVRSLIAQLVAGNLIVPPPPSAVKAWPLVGERIYELWLLASSNLKALLVQAGPQLKPIGSRLLAIVGNTGIDLVKFIIAMIVAGFLFIPGPAAALSTKSLVRSIATDRGEQFLNLAGATIRNVSRGVIGVSALQALLAGIGLIVAGVPAAGLISFLVLVLGIIQIGPSIILLPLVIWSWFAMDTTAALLFTAYTLPVSLLDNVLRPLVMARGLDTPMPVILIGVLGGTIAHGMIGLFVGPIVLSIAWQLLAAWITNEARVSNAAEPDRTCTPDPGPSV